MTISIHALLAESDLICQAPILPCNAFLSTLSLRRATRHKTSKLIINIYFYPRSPCGERRIKPIFSEINTRDFYPRSPCGERLAPVGLDLVGKIFLSTLSLRRATGCLIMIGGSGADFYPRSPCGERPYGRINDISRLIFLSTLSLRRATVAGSCLNGVIGFLSTLSLRRATSGSKGRPATQAISIHALLAESDLIDPEIKIATERFLSTLSLRRATSKGSVSIPRYRNFYPRSPCGERPCPTISANTCF